MTTEDPEYRRRIADFEAKLRASCIQLLNEPVGNRQYLSSMRSHVSLDWVPASDDPTPSQPELKPIYEARSALLHGIHWLGSHPVYMKIPGSEWPDEGQAFLQSALRFLG